MSPSPPPEETAVLLMGYGSPSGSEDLREYLTDVLQGRVPSNEMVAEYVRRYDRIGGSPQRRILESLRAKLERRLHDQGRPLRVLLGYKHWHPHLAEVIPSAVGQGFRRLIAVPLSPYASRWILDPYERGIEAGRRAAGAEVEIDLRSGWHLQRPLIRYWSAAIRRALAETPTETTAVLLSAHSLPQRLRDAGDDYPELLQATCRAIADDAHLAHWLFTYQSAGNTTESWLGPDITEQMLRLRAEGFTCQVVASFGFLFDHLEVLYDLDVVVKQFAQDHGVRYERVPMPNDAPEVVDALAEVVEAGRGRESD